MEKQSIWIATVLCLWAVWLDYRADKKLKKLKVNPQLIKTKMTDNTPLFNLAVQAEQLRNLQKAIHAQYKAFYTSGSQEDWKILGEFIDTERKIAESFDDRIARVINSI